MTVKLATSRGFFGVGCDVLAGIVSALIIGSALAHPASLSVLLVYFTPVPLFLAGLGSGALSCLIASFCGTAALFAAAPVEIGAFYLVSYALPTVGLVYLALRRRVLPDGKPEWFSTGGLMMALVAYPCVIFLAIYAQAAGQDGGLLAMTAGTFDDAVTQVGQLMTPKGQDVTPEMTVKLHAYAASFARIAPAMGMCAWLFATGIMMSLSQYLLQQKSWALRPSFELTQLRAPRWFIVLAVAAIGAAFAPAPYNYVGFNLAILFGVPFFFVGLAVIHDCAAHMRAPTLALVVFYLVISVVVYLAVLVALLGALDQGVNFRKRFADKAPNLSVIPTSKN